MEARFHPHLSLASHDLYARPELQAEVARFAAAGADASVIGSPLRVQPRFAAFANGIAMHADDFDDTLQAASGAAWLQGHGQEAPRYVNTVMADKVVGLHVSQAISLALLAGAMGAPRAKLNPVPAINGRAAAP